MVSSELLEELNIILENEYELTLSPEELSKTGEDLVKFFELLVNFNNRSG